jgi:hypothetical protein
MIAKHAALGDTMIYFAAALLVAAVLLAAVHVRAGRGRPLSAVLSGLIAAFVVLAGAATSWQVYRIGDSGAHSVWGDALVGAGAEQESGR